MFDEQTLFYRCHNGGFEQDAFALSGRPLKITPVSLLVSARRALGNTTGELEVGDKEKTVILKTNMSGYAALPMIQFEKMLRSKNFFLRTKFSLQEFDDTTVRDTVFSKKPVTFELTITARKNSQ
jgi:polyisoprenoid-binding protein YceI